MKNKFIAIITASVIALTPLSVLANYYPDTPLPEFTPDDIVSEPVDMDEFDAAISSCSAAIEAADWESIDKIFLDIYSYTSTEQSAYSAAQLKASQHNTEENNLALSLIYDDLSSMSESLSNLFKELYTNPATTDYFTALFGGEEDARSFIEAMPDEEYYKLADKENQLLNEYYNNSFGTLVYDASDGKSYTLTQLYDELTQIYSNTDGLTNDDLLSRAAMLYVYYRDYVTQSGEILGEIYKELVAVRAQEAAACGYESYADYAYNEIYGRDYTTQDSAQLREYVKKYIVPLSERMSIYSYYSSSHTFSDNEIIESISDNIQNVSPELKTSFDYMINNGFYDIARYDDATTPGTAYTITFGDFPVPYVFVSPASLETSSVLRSLVHEFGHFNALLRQNLAASDEIDAVSQLSGAGEDIDVQEIYSQGLELLFLNSYRDIYGWESEYACAYLVYSMVNSIISGCMYDEWQTLVYNHPDMSIKEMNEAYKTIAEQYGRAASDYDWIAVVHNFENPMYYISYAVSAAAALELWAQSRTDYLGAADKYMLLTAGESGSFCYTLEKYGFENVFDEGTISDLGDEIESYLNGGYSDITADEWYYDAAFMTAQYLDNAEGGTEFRAQDYALRSEMANSVGRLYEIYNGDITQSISSFTDDGGSKYIAWAADNGIVNGYSETIFGANDSLTREQAAAILYRYCSGADIAPISDDFETKFDDFGLISDWAQEAAQWAVECGMVEGYESEGTLIFDPQGMLTRAQLAALLQRAEIYLSVAKEAAK